MVLNVGLTAGRSAVKTCPVRDGGSAVCEALFSETWNRRDSFCEVETRALPCVCARASTAGATGARSEIYSPERGNGTSCGCCWGSVAEMPGANGRTHTHLCALLSRLSRLFCAFQRVREGNGLRGQMEEAIHARQRAGRFRGCAKACAFCNSAQTVSSRNGQ